MRQDFQKTIFKKHNLVDSRKIKFLARLLVLTLFATFIGCNEEPNDIKEQHNSSDKNKISLSQFKNETSLVGIEPLLSVNNKTSISSKSKAQLSDFVIDTVAIKKHISLNNKTTYTFRIYPLSSVAQPNEIYNLVYRKVNNTWETSIFYLKKFPKENSEHKLFEKIERIYGGKVTNAVTSKTSSLEMCSFETLSVRCDGSCRGECDGFGCPTGQCIQRSVTYMSCDSGGSGGGGGSSDPGGISGGGGGSSDPYSYSPNTYDNPVYDDPNYINNLKREYFWESLDYGSQLWAINNPVSYDQIIQCLIQNNWSTSVQLTMIQMMQLSQANNATFSIDSSISSQNSFVFADIGQFQNFLSLNQNAVGKNFEVVQQGNEKISSTKFEYPTYSIKVEIKQQISPTYNLISVSSYKTGVTFLLKWDQTNFAPTYSGNTVKIDLYGTITYGVTMGTFNGLSVTVDVHYEIVLNKTTGAIISAQQKP